MTNPKQRPPPLIEGSPRKAYVLSAAITNRSRWYSSARRRESGAIAPQWGHIGCDDSARSTPTLDLPLDRNSSPESVHSLQFNAMKPVDAKTAHRILTSSIHQIYDILSDIILLLLGNFSINTNSY